MGAEVAGAHRLAVAGVADDDVAQALLEIGERACETEDRHHLGGGDDVEAVLPGKAVADAAQADDDVAQRPVVHVGHPPPGDSPHVEGRLEPPVQVIVEHRRQQVVGERDGAEVAGEMEVDVLHGHDLRVAAAGRAPLHAEDGSERRLAQADRRLLADEIEGVAEADGGGGLALAGRGRRHRRHQDQLAVRPAGEAVGVVERQLGLGVAVRFEALFGDSQLTGDGGDAVELGLLCDFDVRRHS